MGSGSLKLICALNVHHWVYRWKPLRLRDGSSVVVMYRECRECGQLQRHRVDRTDDTGAPIWQKIKTTAKC